MITKEFETSRPIFFISDKEIYSPVEDKEVFYCVEDRSRNILASYDINTIFLACTTTVDRLEEDPDIPENTIYIYLNEAMNVTDDMLMIFDGNLTIPSKTISITDSDDEIIFEKNLNIQSVHLEIYINRNYTLMDLPTVFHINMTY